MGPGCSERRTGRSARMVLAALTLLAASTASAGCQAAGTAGEAVATRPGSTGSSSSSTSTTIGAATTTRPPTSTASTASTADSTASTAGSTAGSPIPAGPIPAGPRPSQGAAAGALPPPALAGTNLAGCRSTSRPVVLLHGTFSTVESNYSALVPVLLAAGRCVYGLDYGYGGVAAVATSASAEARFVGQVLAATGAERVDVVGYSQGGLVLRTALRRDGLQDRVALAVLVAPSFHGSDAPALRSVPTGVCPACADQSAGSALLADLAAGGDLDGAVRYVVLSSEHDTVVTPWRSQVPAGPADRVRSTTLEQLCPGSAVPHEQLLGSAAVLRWVAAALAADGALPGAGGICG